MKLAMPQPSPPSGSLRRILLTALALALIGGVLYLLHKDTLSLTGYVTGTTISVAPAISGTVSHIPVRIGQQVRAGDPLALLEDGALQESLAREIQALKRLETALPPPVWRALAGAAPGLELRLAQAQRAEEEALRFVSDASAAEAGAAVAARRATILKHDGKMGEEDFQKAQSAHAQARRILEQARAEYEVKSLSRSSLGAELSTLHTLARSAGVNLSDYDAQRAARVLARCAS